MNIFKYKFLCILDRIFYLVCKEHIELLMQQDISITNWYIFINGKLTFFATDGDYWIECTYNQKGNLSRVIDSKGLEVNLIYTNTQIPLIVKGVLEGKSFKFENPKKNSEISDRNKVKKLQQELVKRGARIRVDGVIGPETKRAIYTCNKNKNNVYLSTGHGGSKISPPSIKVVNNIIDIPTSLLLQGAIYFDNTTKNMYVVSSELELIKYDASIANSFINIHHNAPSSYIQNEKLYKPKSNVYKMNVIVGAKKSFIPLIRFNSDNNTNYSIHDMDIFITGIIYEHFQCAKNIKILYKFGDIHDEYDKFIDAKIMLPNYNENSITCSNFITLLGNIKDNCIRINCGDYSVKAIEVSQVPKPNIKNRYAIVPYYPYLKLSNAEIDLQSEQAIDSVYTNAISVIDNILTKVEGWN